MKIRNLFPYKLFHTKEFCILIIVFNLSGLYVSADLISAFKPIRYGLVFFLLILTFFHMLRIINTNRITKQIFFALLAHILFIIYGAALSGTSSGILLIESRKYLFIILSVLLTVYSFEELHRSNFFYSSLTYQKLKTKSSIPYHNKFFDLNLIFPVLIIVSPVILYLTNSLILSPIPHLIYDLDVDRNYSQGVTSYFSLGSIILCFLAFSSTGGTMRLVFMVLAFEMLAMAALGGARGDFAIGVFVVFVMMLRWLSIRNIFILSIVLVAIFIFVFPIFNNVMDELVIVRRFEVVLDGSYYGKRDILLNQSVDLLSNSVRCVFIGCGLNYFQVHYGYDFGMYPHNLFAELLISYGVLFGGSLITLILFGIIYGFIFHHRLLTFWVLLFCLGVGLKSGSVLSYASVTVILFFSYLGLCSIGRLVAMVKTN